MLTGATWFPWHGLETCSGSSVCAVNPSIYASEGLGDALPDTATPSPRLWVNVLAIVGMTTVLTGAGLIGFPAAGGS